MEAIIILLTNKKFQKLKTINYIGADYLWLKNLRMVSVRGFKLLISKHIKKFM